MSQDKQDHLDGATLWNKFCDDLKQAGSILSRDDAPKDAFTQSEGVRYLSRLVRAGLEMFVEFDDRDFPVLYRPAHETIKMGGDNPDNHYQKAAIDGRNEYRISGTRGTVHYLGFGTQASNYAKNGRMEPTGYVEAADLDIGPDGRFELILSSEKKAGNWLPMTPETETLIVRQTFHDRTKEVAADLTIERIGSDDTPAPLDPIILSQGLTSAAQFVSGTANLFADWAELYRKDPLNTLTLFSHEIAQSVGGDPNIRYYYGHYEIGEDEALIIESPIPECDYWNFQMNNYWMESLDFRYHRIHLNGDTAHLETPTQVKLVVAHKDPGCHNWIDTAGHAQGILMWRWIGATDLPTPEVTKVLFSEVAS